MIANQKRRAVSKLATRGQSFVPTGAVEELSMENSNFQDVPIFVGVAGVTAGATMRIMLLEKSGSHPFWGNFELSI